MSASTSGWGGKKAYEARYRFPIVHWMLVFTRLMCMSLAEMSVGQMSDSPAKGDTLSVFSFRIGMLSLSPPSTYRCANRKYQDNSYVLFLHIIWRQNSYDKYDSKLLRIIRLIYIVESAVFHSHVVSKRDLKSSLKSFRYLNCVTIEKDMGTLITSTDDI